MYLKSVGKYTSIYYGDMYDKKHRYCGICKGLLVPGEKILCYLWGNRLDAHHRHAHLKCIPNEIQQEINKTILISLLNK